MSATPDETEAVKFAVQTIINAARKMPCRDAAKLVRGLLLVSGPDAFPELRDLFQHLNHCDQQLELIMVRTQTK